jgi:hypothetical protein
MEGFSMAAVHLKIVARDARAIARGECETQAINIYDLDLSDEHMAHVYRFRGLGPFDREDWKRWRSYCAWKRLVYTGQKAPPAATAATNAKEPQHG